MAQAPERRRIIYLNPRFVVNAAGRPFDFRPPTFENLAIWTPDLNNPEDPWFGLASFNGYVAGGFTALGEGRPLQSLAAVSASGTPM